MVAQTESPHWGAPAVGAIYGQLRGAFSEVTTFLGYIPTYPSGAWSWAYASSGRRHDAHFDRPRAEALEGSCHYYNAAIQTACFALPGFVGRELEPGEPLVLAYRLRATMPVKVTVPPAVAYEYYDPDTRAQSAAGHLTVEG